MHYTIDKAAIKDEWGTLAHYCRKRNLNYCSLRTIASTKATSKAIEERLWADGYLRYHDQPLKQEAS